MTDSPQETLQLEKLRKAAAGEDHSDIELKDSGNIETNITGAGLALASLFNRAAMREKMGLDEEQANQRSQEFLTDYIVLVEEKLSEHDITELVGDKKDAFLRDLAEATLAIAVEKGLPIQEKASTKPISAGAPAAAA